jgi:LacI family transcriptional regulator
MSLENLQFLWGETAGMVTICVRSDIGLSCARLTKALLCLMPWLILLDRHPDLKGIYVAGGGMEGAIAALREVHDVPKVALVVNEVTAESRSALIDGYVTMAISTPLKELCQTLIEHMIRSTQEGDNVVSGQQFLEPRIALPEIL